MIPRSRLALLAALLGLAACGDDPGLLLSKVPETCKTPHFCAFASRTARDRGDYAALARYLRSACAQGDSKPCEVVMDAFSLYGFEQAEKVFSFLEPACNAGAADACHALGQLGRPDDFVAAEWFEKGCLLGLGWSCHGLAWLMQSGAIWRDEGRLGRARGRACAAGIEWDCGPTAPDPRVLPRVR